MQISVTWKIKVRLSKFLLLWLKLSPEKIKNPALIKNVFFHQNKFELGTYINIYSFESSMKCPFIKSLITLEQAKQKSLHKP